MKVLNWNGFSLPPRESTGCVIAIGNFDGVHRGHAALLRRLLKMKERLKCPAQVITFDPPPAKLLRPSFNLLPLTTLADRAQLIEQYDIDSLLILNTSTALLDVSAKIFWNDLLCQRLNIQGIVEGRNFCFGKDREGTIELLRQWTTEKQIPLEVVDDVHRQNLRISSSEIRSILNAGDVHLARIALGRCYTLTGIVILGDRRGRTIGFPTCNVAEIPTLIPRDGVYAARTQVNDRRYIAAVNIGPNPTFDVMSQKVEAHLLDFEGELYGHSLTLELVQRLRDTVRFSSIEELQQQLKQDCEQAHTEVLAYERKMRHVRQ